MKILTVLLMAMGVSWVGTCQAQAGLQPLTTKDGCSDGDYIYADGAKVYSKVMVRDPVSHKLVKKDYPDAFRQVCVRDSATGGYRWENLDKFVDGKLVRAPGIENFVPAQPIGLAPQLSMEQQQLSLQQNRACKGKDGITSIGGVMPPDKGDKFYRCVQIYDENLNVKGTGWVELVFKNGELVTTPN